MRTTFNTGNSSLNRELTAILESKNEVRINKSVAQISTKQGRKGWELGAALLIPAVIYTVVLILDKYHLIREF